MTSVLSSSAGMLPEHSEASTRDHAQQQRQQQQQPPQPQRVSSSREQAHAPGAVGSELVAPHRSTSAPPDLALNSSSVFSFGMLGYHQHFRHDSGDKSRGSNGDAVHGVRQPVLEAAQSNGASNPWASAPSPSRQSSGGGLSSSSSSSGRAMDLNELQQAVDALSLQSAAQQPAVIGRNGSPSSSHHNGSDASTPSPSSDSQSYLYNLGLQQSLLNTLNLAALSPAQLSLLQLQMQRLSSPLLSSGAPQLDEQQRQLLLLQQQHAAALMFQEAQQQQQQQLSAYGGRGAYGGNRGLKAGGRDERAGFQERMPHARRDHRGGGDRQYYQQHPSHHHGGVKYKQQGGGGGGYRSHDGRGVTYGTGMYGEGKLLSPQQPLSPGSQSHYQSSVLSGDGNDDGLSSSLLSQFSSSSSLDELSGNVYAIAKDQYGCRLLQRLLDDERPGLVELVFCECFEHINELMTDPFGNYLCQKLIEHCHEKQRIAIINKCSADLVAIALNMHGTRAVQKLVETVSSSAEIELLTAALRQSVVTLIKDLNGNHVIQRCLHHLSSPDNQFIIDAVARHCVSVATHKHGCCVLQRCIDYATPQQRRQLVAEVIDNALELVQDAFGNYVAQYVLDLGDAAVNASLISKLLGHISSLSVQKFSSHVVEQCLELANDKTRAAMLEELTNAERLPRLLQDPYANYVLQKALSVSKRGQFERLVTAIKPHLLTLKHTSFGKRIQHKIMKKFPHLGIELDFEDLSGGNGAGAHSAMYGVQQAMMQQQQQQQNGGAMAGVRGVNGRSASNGVHSSFPEQHTSSSLLFGNTMSAVQHDASEQLHALHHHHQQQQSYQVNGHPLSQAGNGSSLLTGMPQLLHSYPPSSLSSYHGQQAVDPQPHSSAALNGGSRYGLR